MPDSNNQRYYRGKSMKGTFRTGDRLVVEQVSINDLYKGDVVVFKGLDSNGSEKDLVHRIISISKNGLVTRGDNNFHNDTIQVSPDNLIGRVTHIDRKGKKHRIKNGKSGLRRAGFLNVKLHIKKTVWGVCRTPYAIVRKSGIVSKIWKPKIKKIHINTPDGELIKYIHGKRTVGQVWPEEKRVKFKKLYDLVIKC